MPASLPPLQDYYQLNFTCSDPGGGTFPVSFAIARIDAYNGDGTEMGSNTISGGRQLRRLVSEMTDWLARVGWGPASLIDVRANTSSTLAITLPAPD